MGQTITGDLLDNANTASGTTATVTGFSIAGSSAILPANGAPVTLTDPDTGLPMGTLAISANGTYVFDPVDGYVGPAPAVTVYSQSSTGQTAVSALTIDVVPCEEHDGRLVPHLLSGSDSQGGAA